MLDANAKELKFNNKFIHAYHALIIVVITVQFPNSLHINAVVVDTAVRLQLGM